MSGRGRPIPACPPPSGKEENRRGPSTRGQPCGTRPCAPVSRGVRGTTRSTVSVWLIPRPALMPSVSAPTSLPLNGVGDGGARSRGQPAPTFGNIITSLGYTDGYASFRQGRRCENFPCDLRINTKVMFSQPRGRHAQRRGRAGKHSLANPGGAAFHARFSAGKSRQSLGVYSRSARAARRPGAAVIISGMPGRRYTSAGPSCGCGARRAPPRPRSPPPS